MTPDVFFFVEPPYFTQEDYMQTDPVVQSVRETVRFRCRAEGNPRPQITWFKNGRPILGSDSPSSKLDKSSESSGSATRFILRLTNLSESDSGRYLCRVFNRAGFINFTYTLKVAPGERDWRFSFYIASANYWRVNLLNNLLTLVLAFALSQRKNACNGTIYRHCLYIHFHRFNIAMPRHLQRLDIALLQHLHRFDIGIASTFALTRYRHNYLGHCIDAILALPRHLHWLNIQILPRHLRRHNIEIASTFATTLDICIDSWHA